MDTSKSPVEIACDVVGSQAEMARILGVTPAMVNQLVSGRRPVPLEHCAAIEQATAGAVTRRDLRPDDWARIWPELAHSAAADPNSEAEAGQPVLVLDKKA